MNIKTKEYGNVSQLAYHQFWAFSKNGEVLWVKTDTIDKSPGSLSNLERLHYSEQGIYHYDIINYFNGDVKCINKIYYDPITKERSETKEFWNYERDSIFNIVDFKSHGNGQYTFWLDHRKVREMDFIFDADTCDVEFIRIQQVTERQDSFEYGAYMDFPAVNGRRSAQRCLHLR